MIPLLRRGKEERDTVDFKGNDLHPSSRSSTSDHRNSQQSTSKKDKSCELFYGKI
jgi:hypothetical protein